MIFGKKIPGLLLHHQTGHKENDPASHRKANSEQAVKNMAGNRLKQSIVEVVIPNPEKEQRKDSKIFLYGKQSLEVDCFYSGPSFFILRRENRGLQSNNKEIG